MKCIQTHIQVLDYAWREQVHVYKYNTATYVDVYQAALMGRRTLKHA